MCQNCTPSLTRRSFLCLAASGALNGLLPGATLAAGGATTHVTADEALRKLREGNDRYVRDPQLCVAELAQGRNRVAQSQAPWATILSCSDSRVPPELLFGGLNVGELFVARNAGNMVNTATMGTIEYGAAVLGVPLIVVLGHERCGAVAAACDVVRKKARFPGAIGPMVSPIVPAVNAVRWAPGDWIDNAIRENARRMAQRVAGRSSIVANLVSKGKVKVVAAYYDLDTGMVAFLS
jgi:carbonic anhydrase